ncbi:MAG: NADH-ubiquinone oxidoreductase subunit NDUFA12 family protein [Paracoccaceae bacterium]
MISKIANLFIWWNGQTIGTIIYTKFFGVLVGKDEQENSYYTTIDGKKRWVNYKGDCDASSISPVWYSWIHKTTNIIPNSNQNIEIKKNDNLKLKKTNSSKPYHPNNFKNQSLYDDYIPWKP